jgi:predicted phage-related endonuclease
VTELDDTTKEALETYRKAAAEVAKLKEAQESWEAVKEQAQDEIRDFLGESESGTVDGAEVVTFKHGSRTTVDTTRLRTEIPAEVLAPYLRTTPTRLVTVKD